MWKPLVGMHQITPSGHLLALVAARMVHPLARGKSRELTRIDWVHIVVRKHQVVVLSFGTLLKQ